MIRVDPASPVPINDQIKAGLKGLVAKGLLRPGDAAPSIRGLAQALRVNPNTVARAFRELALEGFLEPRRGEGTSIAASARRSARDGLEDARRALADAARIARRSGLSWEDIEAALGRARREEP